MQRSTTELATSARTKSREVSFYISSSVGGVSGKA
jgi:hypothetical protein